MPTNPFAITPASGLGGLQAMREGIATGAEFERKRSAESQRQIKLDEASQILREGSPEDAGAFMVKNPEIAEILIKSQEATKVLSDEEDLKSSISLVTGETRPEQFGLDRAEMILDRGGSAAHSLALAEDATKGGAASMKMAHATWGRLDPKGYENFMKMQGRGAPDKAVPKQKTGAFLVRDEKGNTSVAVGSYDPASGKLTTETAGFDGLDVVSKLGETAREQTARKVEEAGLSKEEKDKAGRYNTLLERGIAAAEGTATFRRGIELLDKIKTGGVSAASLAAKRFFGVEGADEGELSNSLAKAVLSQYRETFGAAFTENEGKKLDRIEASFGKSPENNKRLLAQALKLSERTADRALKAAERREDFETADDIKDLLDFTLSTETTEAAPASQLPPGVTEEDIAETMRIHGVTREQVFARLRGQ